MSRIVKGGQELSRIVKRSQTSSNLVGEIGDGEFGYRSARRICQTQTKVDGSYKLEEIKEGTYNLAAIKQGYGWKYEYEIEVKAKEKNDQELVKAKVPDITLYPEMEVSGTISQCVV